MKIISKSREIRKLFSTVKASYILTCPDLPNKYTLLLPNIYDDDFVDKVIDSLIDVFHHNDNTYWDVITLRMADDLSYENRRKLFANTLVFYFTKDYDLLLLEDMLTA